ncbi:MAG: hypothetical protein NTW19_11765 [Planctomycetota bacterium]|nr:hypothetical protein [Planctomycetota bacterium]
MGVTLHRQLVASGPLPAWAVALIVVAALAGALWLLRGEARARRRPVRLRLLMTTRTIVIVLLGLLLAQLVLVTRREERRPATLLLMADRSRSMLRADAYDGVALLDLAQALGVAGLDGREAVAGRAERFLQAGRPKLAATRATLTRVSDEISQGLPWSERFTKSFAEHQADLTRLAEDLRPLCASLAAIEARAPAATAPATAPAATSPTSAPASLTAVYELPAQLAALAASFANPATALAYPASAAAARAKGEELAQAWAEATRALQAAQARFDAAYLARATPELRRELEEVKRLTRFELAHRLAKRLEADARIAPKHRIELVGFDALTPGDALPYTDLYEPLAQTLTRLTDATLSGLVVLSDGQQNVPDRPAVMTRLTGRAIPFVAAGVGLADEPMDVAVTDYEAPTLVQRDKPVELVAKLKTAAPEGTDIAVTLSDGEKVLANAAIKADGGRRAEVTLSFRLAEKPAGALTLAARTTQPDAAPANDQVRVAIGVLDRPSRVLVVAPTPRWDVVAVMRALGKAPTRLDTVFWDRAKEKEKTAAAAIPGSPTDAAAAAPSPTPAPPPAGTAVAATSPSGAAASRGKIPATLSAMKRYDLVVLDGRAFPGMAESDVALFSDYVAREGGRLIVLHDGLPGGYIERLPSLVGTSAATQPAADAIAGGLSPSASAAAYPAVSLVADPAQSAGLWRTLAQPQRLAPVPSQSLTLLEHAGQPILSVGLAGRGRVYAMGVADLFRLREWDALGSLDHFLQRLVEDALQPGQIDPASPVGLYPRFPVAGARAWVVVHGAAAAPKGKITLPGGESIALAFAAQGPAPAGGEKSGDKSADASGGASSGAVFSAPITINAAGPVTVEIEGQPALKAEVVSPIFNEDVEIRLNREALARLAAQAGGQSVGLTELPERLAELPAKVETTVAVQETRLWNAWAFLILIAAAMTCEWVFRRNSGFAL